MSAGAEPSTVRLGYIEHVARSMMSHADDIVEVARVKVRLAMERENVAPVMSTMRWDWEEPEPPRPPLAPSIEWVEDITILRISCVGVRS